MKVYHFEEEKGVVNALLLIEAHEIEHPMAGEQWDQMLETAIERAIAHCINARGISDVQFVRILSLDEQTDGAVMIGFEAVVPPEIQLGTYRGLEVTASDDMEAASKAVYLAAENMKVDIPVLLVERKLEEMLAQKKADVLESTAFHVLADIYAIMTALRRELKIMLDNGTVWEQAMKVTVKHIGSVDGELTGSALTASIKDALNDHGELPEDFGQQVERQIQHRMDARQRMDPAALADEVFAAYLYTQKKTEAEWKQELWATAETLARCDLMLDKVAEVEHLDVSDKELEQAVEELAGQYGMEPDRIKVETGEEALKYQLRLRKARNLIISTAVVQ